MSEPLRQMSSDLVLCGLFNHTSFRDNGCDVGRVCHVKGRIKSANGLRSSLYVLDVGNLLGIALLDLADPTQVLARQSAPILEPELDWVLFGHVDNVVFSCGQVGLGDEIYVYYGGADNDIGLATGEMEKYRF